MSTSPRVAIVTGSAGGIGLAIALRLADDGFDVVINDISSKSAMVEDAVLAIKSRGRRSIGIYADVSSDEDVKMLVDKTVSELGRLDAMVANAGIVISKALVDMSVEEYDRIMSVNSRGVMLSFKYAAAQMIKQGTGGNIIGASSVAGKLGHPFLSIYSMSKFGVRGLIQAMAQELQEYRIRVNGYSPGLTETYMFHYLKEADADDSVGFKIPDHKPHHVCKPEDVASVVSYLLKPESSFVNGQTITIDGALRQFD